MLTVAISGGGIIGFILYIISPQSFIKHLAPLHISEYSSEQNEPLPLWNLFFYEGECSVSYTLYTMEKVLWRKSQKG